jgi:hypothetical protein
MTSPSATGMASAKMDWEGSWSFTPWSGRDIEQRGIEPDILMALGNQKAPSRTECQVFQNVRSLLDKVSHL